MTEANEKNMDFSIPEHNTVGVLNGDDLAFFYYDIGLDNLQGCPEEYDWDAVMADFSGVLDIDSCPSNQIEDDFVLNKIRFTVSNQKNSDNGSKSAAFFRHLRNAFAHYHIVREGENFILIDGKARTTMRGFVNAELLKKFCFRFLDIRAELMDKLHNEHNSTIEE